MTADAAKAQAQPANGVHFSSSPRREVTTNGGGFMGAGIAGETVRRCKTKCAAEAMAKAGDGLTQFLQPTSSWGRCAQARPTTALMIANQHE